MESKKTVIVIGGARRVGAYLCEQFALKNYNVAIHYNKSESEALALQNKLESLNNSNKIITVKADVSKEADVVNMFSYINEKFSAVDILINNVGIFPKQAEIENISADNWDNILNINLRSHFLTAKEFGKIASNDSRIINFASLGGLEIWKHHILYNVSKAGVITLTKTLARELAPKISVNCICPGIIKMNDDKYFPVAEANIPMKRYAGLKDIFDAVYFFAASSGYITGQILNVDGGMHLSKKTAN